MIAQYQAKLTSEEINSLPLFKFEGKIEVVEDSEHLAAAVVKLRQEKILGFDTESRPSFQKGINFPTALLQLATSDRVYLIRLRMVFPDQRLLDLLSDATVIKTGVAVKDDLTQLRRLSHFNPAGFVDLGTRARQARLQTHGLRNLAAKFLGVRVSKAVRCSNWDKINLSTQQLEYAAGDAWISRELHLRFQVLDLI